jgi:glycosyltransferase involved in cell wall biosynthesis
MLRYLRSCVVKAVWFNQIDFASLCRSTQIQLAKSFRKRGHRLKIIARYRGIRPRLEALDPRPLLLKQLFADPVGGFFFQLEALLLAACEVLRGIDLVLVDHFSAPTMFPLNLLSKAGLVRTRFVLNILSAPVDRFGIRYSVSRWRYNFSVCWAKLFFDGIIAISDLYREDISRRFRISPERIGVCTSGVSADLFNPRAIDRRLAEEIKSRLSVGDRVVIMYHGVLSSNRGLQEAVEALAMLDAEERSHVALIFLGQGPAAEKIASLAQAQGVKDSVRLMEPVAYEEVPHWVSICDAGILPFPQIKWWRMSSPLKLLEYLAMEKPVILTDMPAHRAVTGNAACAFYIPDNSPSQIARAIRRVLSGKDVLGSLGKNGRQIVVRNYTWDRQAKNMLDYVSGLQGRECR